MKPPSPPGQSSRGSVGHGQARASSRPDIHFGCCRVNPLACLRFPRTMVRSPPVPSGFSFDSCLAEQVERRFSGVS